MDLKDLSPPKRLLLGGGPANIDPRIIRALFAPIVTHHDPYFYRVMDEVQGLLRYVFKTNNSLTLPLSGTGNAGMETAFRNIAEPEEEVIIGVNGFFGERMVEVASRAGAKPIKVEAEWGRVLVKEDFEDALKNSNAKAVAVVQGETSTGILQPVKEIAALAREYGAFTIVDAVTSLGGCEFNTDAWGIDICYSASQKCLGSLPGLAPITVSSKAHDAILNRRRKVSSFYFDLIELEKYWSKERIYHHTEPILMVYALMEALRIVKEEGLEERWSRHRNNCLALIAGLEALGLDIFAQQGHNLPSLTAIKIPRGVSDAKVRRFLLDNFNIDISGGQGSLNGKVWRIGLMGLNSNEENVILILEALARALKIEGYPIKTEAGIATAI
ncbi:MAG: alanine--glyoxylate aminotransferase family protein, partial [Candidatus Bathyarchaeota archaeon]